MDASQNKNHGPWPERISTLREIGWMILSVVLGLVVIPASIAVPMAVILNSEGAFIWSLIGGAVVGAVIAYRFYKGILRKRAEKSGRFIEYQGGRLVLPNKEGQAETWPITSTQAGWFSRHGTSNTGRLEIMWLLVESERGSLLFATSDENLKGDWLAGLEKKKYDGEIARDARYVRMFGVDLRALIHRAHGS